MALVSQECSPLLTELEDLLNDGRVVAVPGAGPGDECPVQLLPQGPVLAVHLHHGTCGHRVSPCCQNGSSSHMHRTGVERRETAGQQGVYGNVGCSVGLHGIV